MELRGLEPLAFWMQTIGKLLLGVRRCSLLRVRPTVQDGRCTRGLLYLPAVRTGDHDQERRQDRIDLAAPPTANLISLAVLLRLFLA